MSKLYKALDVLKAVVNGIPEEAVDTHVRNLLDRCEESIQEIESEVESKRTMSVEYCCLRKDCNYVEEFYVNPQDFFDWDNGKVIQDALPYLNASQRELMISNTCDECWKKMYG